MGKAAGAAAAATGSRCSWELRRRGGGCREDCVQGAGHRSGPGAAAATAGTTASAASRENGCGAGRAAKFAREERAAGRTGPQLCCASLARTRCWTAEIVVPAPLRALQKVEAGAGGDGRCGGAARSPPTPCPAASPPRASPAGSPRAGRRRRPPPLPPG